MVENRQLGQTLPLDPSRTIPMVSKATTHDVLPREELMA